MAQNRALAPVSSGLKHKFPTTLNTAFSLALQPSHGGDAGSPIVRRKIAATARWQDRDNLRHMRAKNMAI